MTIDELAKKVADDFIGTMEDFEFESFAEMKDVYDWSSREIKDEVEYMINKQYGNGEWWLDDDGDISTETSSEFISYRKFMNIVRSYIKKWEQTKKIDL